MKSKGGKKVNQYNEQEETNKRTSKVGILPSFFLRFPNIKITVT